MVMMMMMMMMMITTGSWIPRRKKKLEPVEPVAMEADPEIDLRRRAIQ